MYSGGQNDQHPYRGEMSLFFVNISQVLLNRAKTFSHNVFKHCSCILHTYINLFHTQKQNYFTKTKNYQG